VLRRGYSMNSRPGTITAFAVLNMVFGGLFLLCGLLSTADSKVSFNGKDMSHELKSFMESEVPTYTFCRVGMVVANLALGTGFILSGVGLLLLRGWGRTLALACAVLSVCLQLFQTGYQLVLINPATKKFLATAPINLGGLVTGVAAIFTVGLALVLIAYSISLLVTMLQPGVARVFRGPREQLESPGMCST
jgi:hypothetical protein